MLSRPILSINTMDEITKKPKRVVLTIKQIIEICQRLKRGENRNMLLKEYGIDSSTIYDIHKQKDKLMKFYSTTDSTNAIDERLVLTKPKLEQLDTVLYEWFTIKRSEGAPISGPIIIEKAK